MSFYGNVTYYLSNAFQKIVYRNTGSKYTGTTGEQSNGYSNGPSLMPAYEYVLNPRNGSDSAILETGNKWLLFADPDGTIGLNLIKIFHKISEQEAGSAQISGSIDFGSTIGVPIITFDEAGHITNIASQSFTLPENPGVLDLENLKNRIANLESLVTGSYEDPGGLTPIVPEDGSIESQLTMIKNKINEWDLKNGVNDVYKESDGIGTILHEVMVFLGLRSKGLYTENGETKIGYVNTEAQTTDLNSVVFKLRMALNYAQSTYGHVVNNRLAFRELAALLLTNDLASLSDFERRYQILPPDPYS